MTPEEFYLDHYDAGDPFGSYAGGRNPDGPGHLGSDFNEMPAGTRIPSWFDGKVIASGYGSALGNWTVFATGGGYPLLYHLNEPGLPAETHVSYGMDVGALGNTGTLSQGAHAHWGFSPNDPSAATGSVIDPWPLIQERIAAKAPKTIRTKEQDVNYQYRADTSSGDSKKYVFYFADFINLKVGTLPEMKLDGNDAYALAGNALDMSVPGQTAKWLARVRADFEVIRAQRAIGTPEITPETVIEIAKSLRGILVIPTAAENGDAARKAIVK